MGVKKHYILQSTGRNFAGPSVYYTLVELYKTCFKKGYLDEPYNPAMFGGKSWRSKVCPLHLFLRKKVGEVGTLRELKVNNAKQDPFYRSTMLWLARHYPQAKTPPTKKIGGKQ